VRAHGVSFCGCGWADYDDPDPVGTLAGFVRSVPTGRRRRAGPRPDAARSRLLAVDVAAAALRLLPALGRAARGAASIDARRRGSARVALATARALSPVSRGRARAGGAVARRAGAAAAAPGRLGVVGAAAAARAGVRRAGGGGRDGRAAPGRA